MLTDSWQPAYSARDEAQTLSFQRGGLGCGTRYQTPVDYGMHCHSDHGTAWLALAESTRMCSITAMRLLYHRKKVEYYIGLPSGPEDGPTYGVLRRMLVTTGSRLFLIGIAQSGLQLNLQATLLAMTTLLKKSQGSDAEYSKPLGFDMDHHVVNLQMLAGLAIGLLNFGKGGYDTWCTWKWIHEAIKLWEEKPPLPHAAAVRTRHIRDLKSGLRCLGVGLVVYVLIGMYTIFKLFSVFLCPYCMVNITGCAEIHRCCFDESADDTCWLHKS